jgi:hypothetical protein
MCAGLAPLIRPKLRASGNAASSSVARSPIRSGQIDRRQVRQMIEIGQVLHVGLRDRAWCLRRGPTQDEAVRVRHKFR